MRINISYRQRFYQYPLHVRALLSILAGMLGILTIGTIIGLARPADAEPIIRLGEQTRGTQAAASVEQSEDVRIFSGLGRLRIPLSNSSTMLLSIAFPYPANDAAFSEELAARIGDFRTMAAEYFSSLPEEKIIIIDEETAKQEILRKYNAALRL